MIRFRPHRLTVRLGLMAVAVCLADPLTSARTTASAGGPPVVRRVWVPSTRYVPTTATNPSGGLGTFYPTPYLMVRGNAPTGGGYSPLGSFGDATLTMYGPLSSYRNISAPVWTYSRGYDGRTNPTPGTSFSTPYAPDMTGVVYPTQGTNYFGFRESGSPPWFANGINWIDQN